MTKEPVKQQPPKFSDELFMSSKQWLRRHSLKKLRLNLQNFLQTLVFNHCDGVVDIHRAPNTEGGITVSIPYYLK